MAACNQNLSVECPRLHQPRLSCQQFLLLPLAYEAIISIITYLCKRKVFSHIRHNGIRHDYRQLPTIATSPFTVPPKNTESKYTGIRIPANPIKIFVAPRLLEFYRLHFYLYRFPFHSPPTTYHFIAKTHYIQTSPIVAEPLVIMLLEQYSQAHLMQES